MSEQYTTTLELYARLEHAAKQRGSGQLDALQARLGREDLFYLLTRLLGRRILTRPGFSSVAVKSATPPTVGWTSGPVSTASLR